MAPTTPAVSLFYHPVPELAANKNVPPTASSNPFTFTFPFPMLMLERLTKEVPLSKLNDH